MELKDKIMAEQAMRIAKITQAMGVHILEEWKKAQIDNGLTYVGPLLNLDLVNFSVSFHKDFENWCFKNATLLRENVTINLILENYHGTRTDKRKATRNSKRNRGTGGKKKPEES